ncbi:hypothetical protein [Catellatospora sp. NPDC049133]|uniref:hypothetical protein n=1 Tax=Catellatospora sp. NPDC049133 TaxID=3155499 RepID=UPI0033FFA8BC
MTTDIYGCVEVRYPFADHEYWSDEEPWTVAMDLFPLLTDQDYAAFGCLFGVRNYQGWTPLAEGRGLPADASTELRERIAKFDPNDIHGLTWVGWGELRDLDMAVRPPGSRGRIRLHEKASHRRWWVSDQWPAEIIEQFGQLPWGEVPGDTYGRHEVPGAVLTYDAGSRAEVIGPGSGWEHVFAVMSALAGKFGDEGVRLVVHFD